MAKNRKNQSAAIRFGPALAATFACLIIAGAAVGYVWQKSEIMRLGKQIRMKENRLAQLQEADRTLARELADLQSPMKLDQQARQFGLLPAQPAQVFRLPEPAFAPTENDNSSRQFAERPVGATTQ